MRSVITEGLKGGSDIITRKTTKEILMDSLRELSKSKSVDKITVREIVRNCSMSAATFYRHFHDKYDLISWVYNQNIKEIYMQFCRGEKSWKQALVSVMRVIESDKDFYKNALNNTERQNSFFQSSYQLSIDLLNGFIKQKGNAIEVQELLFDLKLYMRGASFIITDWCLNNQSYSIEKIANYLCNAMPPKLSLYLV